MNDWTAEHDVLGRSAMWSCAEQEEVWKKTRARARRGDKGWRNDWAFARPDVLRLQHRPAWPGERESNPRPSYLARFGLEWGKLRID